MYCRSSIYASIASSAPPFSLYDYLREELLSTDFDSHQELKWERVSNWLGMPWPLDFLPVSYVFSRTRRARKSALHPCSISACY